MNYSGWPESIIRLLRGIRTSMYISLEPIDYICRIINGRYGYPPLWLRSYVGSSPKDFESSGGEYTAYLKVLCNIKPDSHILDIGCGCGLIPLYLKDYLRHPEGQYIGVDIHKPSIRWCKRVIEPRHSNFSFYLLGSNTALPSLATHSFDVVLVKSVFTHLFSFEVISYLGEIKRLLKPEGICLATFFLSDKVNIVGYARKTRPRLAVVYGKVYIEDMLKQLGFNYEIKPGTWDGTPNGLSLQDIVIIRPGK